jgi:hypothetical protein
MLLSDAYTRSLPLQSGTHSSPTQDTQGNPPLTSSSDDGTTAELVPPASAAAAGRLTTDAGLERLSGSEMR